MLEMNVNHVNMISYEGTQKQISLYIALSWFHMHNLHPGWPFERCFKNLHPGANLLLLSRWSKFICTRVQICSYFRGGTNYLHPGANCEYELKICIFYTFDQRF